MIECKHFSYAYPQATDLALEDINFSVPQGSFNVICGPSGAGKSTLCKALAGIVPNYYGGGYKGDVIVEGKSNIGLNIADIAMQVGIVLDDYESQLVSLTVEEELSFCLSNRQFVVPDIKKSIAEILTAVGLPDRQSYSIDELSGGQRQRLVIASALISRPKVLVLDEPVSALDPQGAMSLYKLIDSLRDKFGVTIIVVEHNLNYVLPYMQNILLLDKGVQLKFSDMDNVLKTIYQHTQLRELLPELWQIKLAIEHKCHISMGSWRNSTQAINELKAIAVGAVVADTAAKHIAKVEPREIIGISNVNFAYRTGEPVLNDINLSISKGEFVALLGANGNGKTTLSRLLMRLNKVRSGEIKIGGVDTAGLEPADIAHTVGYVFQNPDLQILADTVFEEVAYGARLKGYDEDTVTQLVESALTAVGLSEFQDKYPRLLSFGQKRRLAIAAALVLKPQVLILDEITSGQDNLEKKLVMDYLTKLNRQDQLTLILITHDMQSVLAYCNRALVLNKGELVFDGSVPELFSGMQPLGNWGLSIPSTAQLANEFNLPNSSVPELANGFESLIKEEV